MKKHLHSLRCNVKIAQDLFWRRAVKMLKRIYFVQRKPAISVFYFLFMTLFLILSCETGEALNFTPNQEGVCPPRDARCCPDEMDECSFDEMREAGKCEMGDELDYGLKKGRCTNDKTCRPVGLNDEVFVFACRERCTEAQTACLDNNNDATCVDVMRDNDNCGGCFYDGTGNRCAEAVSCKNGYCQLVCPTPQISCGGVCVNPQSDNENCGGCRAEGKGAKCTAGLRCSNGECATDCAEGYVPCGEACINPNNDPLHCGACSLIGQDNKCDDGYQCIDAECKPFCAEACQNGGTCSAPNTCTCTAGWSGETCTTPVCSPSCKNGGTCSASHKCICASGWSGETCTTPVCSPSCKNGGTCTGPNTCTCASGWGGNTCTTPVCNPSCQNGGTCNSPNKCTCASDWSGETCTTPVCSPSCKNGGTCSASHKCICASGWSGERCETPVCSIECQNGGICIGSNTCSCPISWIGQDCSTPDRVRIPASGTTTTFVMGRPDSDTWGYSEEQPSHNVTLDAYMMDRYLVTAASYKLCVDAGDCTVADTSEDCTYGVAGKEKHPINCVDWMQAKAYCEWAGGRLPTEAEWERAAKGTTHRRYPWGDECPKGWDDVCEGAEWTESTAKANCHEYFCNDGFKTTSPVDQFPAGRSPDGVYDMAGNIFEWTSDWAYRTYTSTAVTNPTGPASGQYRVIRGGFWPDFGDSMRAAYRATYFPPDYYHSYIGLRCASSVP
ncbi:MAG: SUMF1/EgtB/PvdO family nonheme iron enzyme [Bradymonadales bacterium]